MSLKIGFIPLYNLHLPSSRYRVFQFLAPLAQAGFRCRHLPAPERDTLKRLVYLPRLFSLARWADVLYVQKRTFPSWVLIALLRLNPRLIFDFDDAIYLQPQTQPRLQVLLKAARVVVAGNSYLAEYAFQYNPQIEIIPSVVDSHLYHPPSVDPLHTERHPGESRVILGWIGSDPNRGDLLPLKPVFDALAARYPGQVVFRTIGRRSLEMKTLLPLEHRPWEMVASRRNLQEFDIGLMPLEDTEWNRGKCAFKLIQYMSVAAAAVASPVGVNQEVLLDGLTGYLAASPLDWQDRLSALIDDPALRHSMGARARKRVLSCYSVDAVLPHLISVLQSAAR